MSGMKAKDILAEVKARGLETIRLCFVDQHGILRGKTLVAEALRRGAAGYLSKTLDGAGLADAVVKVASGERVLPGDRANGIEHGAWPGQEHGLSAREAEMMALITQGFSNAEIAERSYLSINSVKTYIRTAYRKLGLSRRSQAVRWGLEHGFLPPEPRRTDTARGVAEVAAPRQ